MNRLLIVPLALVAFLLAACSGASSGPVTSSNVQEITLITRDLEFEPQTIEVTAGQRIELTLRNEGALEHDFSVMHIQVDDVDEHSHASDAHEMQMTTAEEPAIHVAAVAGETGLLRFSPREPGTYEFYCAVPGHKEAGMIGTLIVHSP
jgi:uncharacterized cupredoxin-like copper-binding protein